MPSESDRRERRRDERARDKARFCLATGIQPSEYDQMTIRDREAFFIELKAQNRKGR